MTLIAIDTCYFLEKKYITNTCWLLNNAGFHVTQRMLPGRNLVRDR
jgi:hypothetical protein